MPKQGIHPNYREVVFLDQSNGFKFVTRSCAPTKETIKLEDGRTAPVQAGNLFRIARFLHRHPKSVDSLGGRVEKFRNKFAVPQVISAQGKAAVSPVVGTHKGSPGCPFACIVPSSSIQTFR